MAETFVPMDPDAQLGYVLVRCAEQMARAWHEALREHGVNPRQFSMLAELAHDPGISQGELARRVMVTPQSLSESLTRLIDAGLIGRGTVERGRPARLTLTGAGRDLLARAYPVVSAHQDEAFAALTGKERTDLARILGKLMR